MVDNSITPVLTEAPPGPLLEFWRHFSENRGAVLGLFVIICMVVIALGAPWLAPYAPQEQYRDALLVPPAWAEGGSLRFWLGTDDVGRDMLSR
jgi:dipeptide transport system permease protein